MELENMNNAQIEAGAVNPEGYAEGPHMEEHGAEPHTSQEPENGGMNAEGGQQADPKPFQPQEQPWKTPENAMAAQRRREMEAARRERMFREVTDGMVDPRTNQPFANEQAWRDWKNEMAVKAAAQKAGIDTAAAQTVMDDLRENLRQTDPEYQRMARENEQAKAAMAQQTFEQDLRSIKKAYRGIRLCLWRCCKGWQVGMESISMWSSRLRLMMGRKQTAFGKRDWQG